METKQTPKYNRISLPDLKKISTDRRAQSLAWLSLTIFTVSFFSIVAIRPTFITIAKLVRELKEKREGNRQLEQKIKTLIAAREVFVNNTENISLLDQALPTNSEFPLVAYFFEQKAQSFLITIGSLNIGKIPLGQKTKNNEPAMVSFSVSATGRYQDLKNFLFSLESSRRIIKIESSIFSQVLKKTETESETRPEISLSVSGKFFFLPK